MRVHLCPKSLHFVWRCLKISMKMLITTLKTVPIWSATMQTLFWAQLTRQWFGSCCNWICPPFWPSNVTLEAPVVADREERPRRWAQWSTLRMSERVCRTWRASGLLFAELFWVGCTFHSLGTWKFAKLVRSYQKPSENGFHDHAIQLPRLLPRFLPRYLPRFC